jgi:hypothetical protein
VNRVRAGLFAVGVGSVAVVGGAVAVASALGGPLLAAQGGTIAVTAAGVLGVVVLTLLLGVHWIEGVAVPSPPTPETVVTGPRPGEALRPIDEGIRPPIAPGDRRRIEERLRRVAVETVVQRDGCAREAAAERVDDGSWTDDPVAAAFFAADPEGWIDRTRAAARFRPRARHAARTIVRIGDRGDHGERDP